MITLVVNDQMKSDLELALRWLQVGENEESSAGKEASASGVSVVAGMLEGIRDGYLLVVSADSVEEKA